MPILNYTTTIKAAKTVGEIQGILAAHGAESIQIGYERLGRDQPPEPTALTFVIAVEGQLVHFRLPCRWRGARRAMQRDRKVPPRLRTDEQALRVAWRILKDWVEAQMALLDAEQAELAEIFLPYAVNLDADQTMYEAFRARLALPAPEGERP